MDPHVLNQEMKNKRVRTSRPSWRWSTPHTMMSDRIVTMDKSAVSFHTPQIKQQSKQWLGKGTPGPIKAKVHATGIKHMVLAFFDNKGLIYTNYVPQGNTVYAKYITEALGEFLEIFKQKRLEMAARDWCSHWDNAPIYHWHGAGLDGGQAF
jgi:hypothetical protein